MITDSQRSHPTAALGAQAGSRHPEPSLCRPRCRLQPAASFSNPTLWFLDHGQLHQPGQLISLVQLALGPSACWHHEGPCRNSRRPVQSASVRQALHTAPRPSSLTVAQVIKESGALAGNEPRPFFDFLEGCLRHKVCVTCSRLSSQWTPLQPPGTAAEGLNPALCPVALIVTYVPGVAVSVSK